MTRIRAESESSGPGDHSDGPLIRVRVIIIGWYPGALHSGRLAPGRLSLGTDSDSVGLASPVLPLHSLPRRRCIAFAGGHSDLQLESFLHDSYRYGPVRPLGVDLSTWHRRD